VQLKILKNRRVVVVPQNFPHLFRLQALSIFALCLSNNFFSFSQGLHKHHRIPAPKRRTGDRRSPDHGVCPKTTRQPQRGDEKGTGCDIGADQGHADRARAENQGGLDEILGESQFPV
jgi:hypothetical protein